jgi:hypothetical protein
MKVRRRPESFIASVLLDLSAALELPDVYNAIVNEVMAVEACPQVVECDDDQSQYRDTLEGVRIELWMRYDERFDTQSGWQCAPHHRRFTPLLGLSRPEHGNERPMLSLGDSGDSRSPRLGR